MADYYNLSVSQTLEKLKTNEKKGLSTEEAENRLKKYGPNELKHEGKLNPVKIFLLQFKNVMVLMLLIATIISYSIGETVDAIVILIILIINALLGFFQEYKAEKAMEALLELAAPHAVVIRDGEEDEVFSSELVKGDVVVLNVGDRVPANIRLIKSIGLKVNQAHLTGESVSVEKTIDKISRDTPVADRKNMVFMSSIITSGKGIGVVTATGMETEMGRIAKTVQKMERDLTPLQEEIFTLGKYLAGAAVSLALILFIIGVMLQRDIIEMLMASISLSVAAVPEGLPAVITVTLAIGMQRMAKKNAVVRKLTAVQTLGNVTVICTDKTGTLTKNEMTVTKVYDGYDEYDVTGTGYKPEGEFKINNNVVELERIERLLHVGVICNNAYLSSDEGYDIIGDPTEGSLLVLAGKAGINHMDLKDEYNELGEVSFNSKRKRMSVIVKKDEKFIYSKGAPDIMLDLCSKIKKGDKVKDLTLEMKKKILKKNEEFAKNALRVLALCYKPLNEEVEEYDERLEQELIFLGLVGMIDPPREEVKHALKLCKNAGIRVMMITGDYITTARAIGKSIGLIEEEDNALTSGEIDKLSDEDFKKAVKSTTIFARISPENKHRIVNTLKENGEIVAVTGDGVNDAPALKAAHIGIAMGITGTDVSKEASEMVLTDDNFSTIVSAVKEGRGIFDNIKKFIKFLLSSNADTIIEVGTAILLGLPLPYLPIHILWMNLITDGPPALALSVDPPDDKVMEKEPRDPNHSLIREVGLFVIFAGLIDALSSVMLFYFALSYEGFFTTGSALALSKARTMSISSAILFELLFVFNCRDDDKGFFDRSFKENFLSNKILTISVIISIIFQVLFIYNPVLNTVFKTTPLSLFEFGIVLIFSSLGLLMRPKWFHKNLNE